MWTGGVIVVLCCSLSSPRLAMRKSFEVIHLVSFDPLSLRVTVCIQSDASFGRARCEAPMVMVAENRARLKLEQRVQKARVDFRSVDLAKHSLMLSG
jgi:hypothetical protein